MSVVLRRVRAFGWNRCVSLSNGAWEVIATTEVGPRVVFFGPCGGANLLQVFPQDAGRSGGRRWRLYGGHRFWICPETKPYAPDNRPVAWEPLAQGVRLRQAPERGVPWRKILELRLHPSRARVHVRHRLVPVGPSSVPVAPWGITVFPGGGQAWVPLPRRGDFPQQVAPAGPLVLWPYTHLGDRRWHFGRRHLFLRVPARQGTAQKLGLSVPEGWVAYRRRGRTCTVRFQASPHQGDTDFGAHVELFTQAGMVELETLGPRRVLVRGEEHVHEEVWEADPTVLPPPQ